MGLKHLEYDAAHRSVCPFDCPDTCGLLGYVKDGRLVGVGGDPEHPVSRGHICAKVAFDHHRVHGPDRLTHPLKRTGPKGSGRFARVSWDEAIETITSNFKRVVEELGSEAILPYSYAGTMGVASIASMDRRFFSRLGASQLQRSICSSAGNAGYQYTNGSNRGTDPEETVDSRYIIAWGANLVSANLHQMSYVQEARRNGAKLVVIDVHRNKTGDAADWYIPIYPGTDGALALGLMRAIVDEGLEDGDWIAQHTGGFERLRERLADYPVERVSGITRVPAEDIRRLAREYATTQPAFIRIGNGIQHHDNGGMCVRNIACLPALVGAWRHRGGGAMKSNGGYSSLNEAAMQRPDPRPGSMERPARTINMNQLGRALLEERDPPISALYVYNANPAAVTPNQARVLDGLRREDLFVAVHDVVLTDTCRYADVVLPATTHWEQTDLFKSYWHLHLALAEPAIEPVGEAKPNVEVFRLLAAAMGFDDPCFQDSVDDILRQGLDFGANPALRGISLERLRRERVVRLTVPERHQPFTRFFSEEMARDGYDPLPCYQPIAEPGEGLLLITPPNHYFLNSTLAGVEELRRRAGEPTLQICPADAAARGVADGDPVIVRNLRGQCRLTARLSDTVAPGVVVSQGIWWPSHAHGGGVNQTTADRLADMGGGAVFFSNRVEVERLTTADGRVDGISSTPRIDRQSSLVELHNIEAVGSPRRPEGAADEIEVGTDHVGAAARARLDGDSSQPAPVRDVQSPLVVGA
ncbi:MAG: molybdopterin-containing oxidoreductase family protein [Chloroflexota bacterium]